MVVDNNHVPIYAYTGVYLTHIAQLMKFFTYYKQHFHYLIFAFILMPQSIWGSDLISVWRSALDYDPNLSAARAALLAGQEKQSQGLAGLLPQIKMVGQANRHIQQNSHGNLTTHQHVNSVNYKLVASQVLYDSKIYIQYQQGKKTAEQAGFQFIAAQQDRILQVAQAYFEVVLAAEQIKQIHAQEKAVLHQIKQAKKSFEVGLTPITDYNETQARYDEIIALEVSAQNNLLIKQNALLQLAQVDPNKLAKINPQFTPTLPEPASLEYWLQQAQQKNLTIQEKQLQLSIDQDEIKKYRLLNSPILNVEASYGRDSIYSRIDPYNRAALPKSDRDQAAIALVLTVPLSTGGYRSSKLRETLALAEKNQQQLEWTTRQALHKTRIAFFGVKNGVTQINALRKALASSQSMVESTVLGHEVGVRSTEDVLKAQQQFYTTKFKLVEAYIKYMLSRLELAAAAGILQEQDLYTINQWLVSTYE